MLDKEVNEPKIDNEVFPYCPFKECCNYGDYQQCYNHSHVLCERYEEFSNFKNFSRDAAPQICKFF